MAPPNRLLFKTELTSVRDGTKKPLNSKLTKEEPVSMLPPRDPRDAKMVSTSLYLPEWLKDRLQGIAEEEGFSRNEVVAHFLKRAVEQYEQQKTRQQQRRSR